MENKANRIYDKGTRQWFDVSPDAYEAYDRERTAFRKKMQHQGICRCPRSKWWLCDMMCMYCDYRCDGTLSLNMPQGDDEDVTLMDIIPDGSPAMEEVQADRDLLDRLIRRLYEIDPDAESILAMWKENDKISDLAMAEALGCKQRTFADRMKRIRTEMRKIRGC